ncbi:hypothetical protein N7490_009171 [Penicillium lividum]|nr:hypothetical protein N7490_009171 [Penicillium lividum]
MAPLDSLSMGVFRILTRRCDEDFVLTNEMLLRVPANKIFAEYDLYAAEKEATKHGNITLDPPNNSLDSASLGFGNVISIGRMTVPADATLDDLYIVEDVFLMSGRDQWPPDLDETGRTGIQHGQWSGRNSRPARRGADQRQWLC